MNKLADHLASEIRIPSLLAFLCGISLMLSIVCLFIVIFDLTHQDDIHDATSNIQIQAQEMQKQIDELILYQLRSSPQESNEMISPDHLENDIIRPTLKLLAQFDNRLYTESAVNLLLGTAAQETDGGYYLKQYPSGPGRGPYSMEIGDNGTHRSIWQHYLNRPTKQYLRELVLSLVPDSAVHTHPDGWIYVDDNQLVGNLPYATAMARLKYWPIKKSLPAPQDIVGLGDYWNEFYNANDEYGTTEEFVESWKTFVAIK